MEVVMISSFFRGLFCRSILFVLLGALPVQLSMVNLCAMQTSYPLNFSTTESFESQQSSQELEDSQEISDNSRGVLDVHPSQWGLKQYAACMFVFVLIVGVIALPVMMVVWGPGSSSNFGSQSKIYVKEFSTAPGFSGEEALVKALGEKSNTVCTLLDATTPICCVTKGNSQLHCCVESLDEIHCLSRELTGAPHGSYKVTPYEGITPLENKECPRVSFLEEEKPLQKKAESFEIYSCLINAHKKLSKIIGKHFSSSVQDSDLGECLNGTLRLVKDKYPALRSMKSVVAEVLFWEKNSLTAYPGTNKLMLGNLKFNDDFYLKVFGHEIGHLTQNPQIFINADSKIRWIGGFIMYKGLDFKEYWDSNPEVEVDFMSQLNSFSEDHLFDFASFHLFNNPSFLQEEIAYQEDETCLDRNFNCYDYLRKYYQVTGDDVVIHKFIHPPTLCRVAALLELSEAQVAMKKQFVQWLESLSF